MFVCKMYIKHAQTFVAYNFISITIASKIGMKKNIIL